MRTRGCECVQAVCSWDEEWRFGLMLVVVALMINGRLRGDEGGARDVTVLLPN